MEKELYDLVIIRYILYKYFDLYIKKGFHFENDEDYEFFKIMLLKKEHLYMSFGLMKKKMNIRHLLGLDLDMEGLYKFMLMIFIYIQQTKNLNYQNMK